VEGGKFISQPQIKYTKFYSYIQAILDVFYLPQYPLSNVWGVSKGEINGESMHDVSHQYIKKGFWHKKVTPGI
jgi:vacuolar-type H+-ATPase subunit C/Vma6